MHGEGSRGAALVYPPGVTGNLDPGDVVAASLRAAREAPGKLRGLCTGLGERDCARKPGVGKLSLLEHVWHMLDMEREVFGVRMRRVLAEDDPNLEPLDVEEHTVRDEELEGHSLGDVIARWEVERLANLHLVEGTGPEQWRRPLRHPQIGRAKFVDLVSRWARHDAEHLRQIEILALNCRERNLP